MSEPDTNSYSMSVSLDLSTVIFVIACLAAIGLALLFWRWMKARPGQVIETLDRDPGRAILSESDIKAALAPKAEPDEAEAVPMALSASPAVKSPPSAELLIENLSTLSGNEEEKSFAGRLSKHLALVISRLAPHLVIKAETAAGSRAARTRVQSGDPHFRLSGSVLRVQGQKMQVSVEMVDRRSGARVFLFHAQALPNEEERLLAEVTSRVLKHAA